MRVEMILPRDVVAQCPPDPEIGSADPQVWQQQVDAWRRLVDLVLTGAPLSQLVVLAEELLGNPVAFLSSAQRVLVQTPDFGEAGRPNLVAGSRARSRLPATLPEHKNPPGAHLYTRGVCLVSTALTGSPHRVQYMAAAVARGTPVGYAVVAEARTPLDNLCLALLPQVAAALALYLDREQAIMEIERRFSVSLVEQLVTGNFDNGERLADQARLLGHDLSQPHRILVATAEAPETALGSLCRLAHQVADQHKLNVTAAIHGKRVVAMLAEGASRLRPVTEGLVDTFGHAWLRAAARELPAIQVIIGVSEPCIGAPGYLEAFRQALMASCFGRGAGRSNCVVAHDSLGVIGLLAHSGDSEYLLRATAAAIGPLLSYDADHGTDMVSTLECYLQNDSHLNNTARALHIHPATLRYRLGRIEEILGREITPAAKFELWLIIKARRAAELSQQTTTAGRLRPPVAAREGRRG